MQSGKSPFTRPTRPGQSSGEKRLRIGLEISSLAFPLSGIQVYINNVVRSLLRTDTANQYFLTTKLKQYLRLRAYGASPSWPRHFDVFHGFDGFLPRLVRAGLKSAIVHDVLYLKNRDYHTEEQRKRLLKKLDSLIRRADIIISPSLATKDDLSDMFPPERIFVVPEGCSEAFRPMPEAAVKSFRQGLGAGRYMLFVGVFQRRKNIERLLDAFRIIKKESPDLKLVMVTSYFGYGSREVMQKISEMKDDILLKVGVEQEELISLYNGAEVFLFPSLAEGFGLPVLEAMACGTPVVTSRLSAMPETGGDAVAYCDPYDAGDIAATALDVLNNDSRRRDLRRLGMCRAAAFSWTESAKKLLSVWEESLAMPR
ncbi:MAG: glycosyltransferase family 4 protein [Deltaproteobacteria bacterium]|nr:glycosyltransferase family 4 protein [Deltaproteobacteria bacterium]MCL5276628.1 glycosyltransferase family 4 protein [Deltaproteobacteria bacterium]